MDVVGVVHRSLTPIADVAIAAVAVGTFARAEGVDYNHGATVWAAEGGGTHHLAFTTERRVVVESQGLVFSQARRRPVVYLEFTVVGGLEKHGGLLELVVPQQRLDVCGASGDY